MRRWPLVVAILFVAGLAVGHGTPAQSANGGHNVALLIGNEAYTHWPDLQTPARDVERLETVLRDRYGFDVTVLRDASRGDIIDELERLKSRLTERDSLLVYYAGHGTLRSDGGYWVGADASKTSRSGWLHYQTINDLIDRRAGMKARHVLVIADSCYSGVALRSAGEETRPPNQSRRAWQRRMTEKPSRRVMTSGGTEPVLDRIGTSEHSVFARELIERLELNDDLLEAQELHRKIQAEVFARAQRVLGDAAQAPESGPILGVGHQGGDFVFRPVGVTLSVPEPTAAAPAAGFGIRGDEGPASGRDATGISVTDFAATLAIVPEILNVRTRPGGAVIGTLTAGTEVSATGFTVHERRRWYRIEMPAGGGVGYIHGGFVRIKRSDGAQEAAADGGFVPSHTALDV